MREPLYCTILARNYLARALVLSDSLQRHGTATPLVVFLIDAVPDDELPAFPGVRWMRPASLDLPDRDVLDLAMSYDLVEFATALKPVILQTLLRESDHVVYLDPDTYVTSPMVELSPALDASAGVVLTPHYLQPNPDGGQFSDSHLLVVGVYNLGFCAVSREADAFLTWWWGHLRRECLVGLLDGLFTDQKWVDVGAVLFDCTTFRHAGYNVSVTNLHERPIVKDGDGYVVTSTGDPLRLFHFHAFDPFRPDHLNARPTTGTAAHYDDDAVRALSHEYAAALIAKQHEIGEQPGYIYGSDTRGRRISRRVRHAFRTEVLSTPGSLPSPFIAAEADAYDRWRRASRGLAGRLVVSDLAKGARGALPEEYDTLKRRFPGLAKRLRAKYVQNTGMWG